MHGTIPGCAYCFKRLTSDDHAPSTAAMACTSCGKSYHTECWQREPVCSQCGSMEAVPTTPVIPPHSKPILRKPRALPIKPSGVIYQVGSRLLTPAQMLLRRVGGAVVLLLLFGLLGSSLYSRQANSQPRRAVLFGSSETQPTPLVATVTLPPSATPVEAVPTNVPTPVIMPGLARVQNQELNLRAEPGVEASIRAVLPRGAQVQVLGESRQVGEAIWVSIQAGEQSGWVNQRYLSPVSEADGNQARGRVVGVRPAQLLVRSGPGRNAAIVDRLTEGTEVQLFETRENSGIQWRRVVVDRTSGWVRDSYLQPLP